MPFPELVLTDAPPPATGLPSRADVAVFVGLVGRRAGALPAKVRADLVRAGWAGTGTFARSEAKVAALLDVPVAVSSWSEFDALYAWDERPVAAGSAQVTPCPLGLAVHSFFLEGGIKAWIVRTGDPLPLLSDAASDDLRKARAALVSWGTTTAPVDAAARVPLIPAYGSRGTPADAADPGTWHGVAHIWGIDDAAMLSLPDLPTLFSGPAVPVDPLAAPPAVPEVFKPCAPAIAGVLPDARIARPAVSGPRCDRAGYGGWAQAINQLLGMLAAPRGVAHRRDVMLMASLPLPALDGDVGAFQEAPLSLLDAAGIATGGKLGDTNVIGSARLQLAWPWVVTALSASQPEGVEAPEGVVMGAIARTALAAGAYRSAASQPFASVAATLPELREAGLRATLPDGRADWLGDRLCLVGRKPLGLALLSDATMSADAAWRAGGVSRLMGIILRAARWLGQDRLFELSGPALWARIALDLESFLTTLWTGGALSGASAAEAFEVHCDATTITQADIDAGRVIVTIGFTAAQPIQRVAVTLALGNAGLAPMAEAA